MQRRSFLLGFGATLLAAPTIVRASSLMTVKARPGLMPWRTLLMICPAIEVSIEEIDNAVQFGA